MKPVGSAPDPDPRRALRAERPSWTLRRVRRAAIIACLVTAGLSLAPRPARAFGGVYFAEQERPGGVTEHRVAVALGPTQTVMWDQVRWSGNPSQVAWIGPVRPGADVSTGADAWFAALDGSTRPYVYTPPSFGPSAGCMIAGCQRDPAFGEGPERFRVERVGAAQPVEQARFRAADDAIAWLASSGFAPTATEEADLRATVAAGFELAALRYAPSCGVRAIRPVRVDGPRTTEIPTRLMKAGVTSQLSLTLFVLGERRYAPAPLTAVEVDLDELTWDDTSDKSNYDDLASKALGRASGRSVLTEYADQPTRAASSRGPASFLDVYPALCGRGATPARMEIVPPESVPASQCRSRSDAGVGDAGVVEAGPDAGEDADTDAGDDAQTDASDDGGTDAGRDAAAGTPSRDAGGIVTPPRDDCPSPDDLALAVRGLDLPALYLTRMRGSVSTSLLSSQDLSLAPAEGGDVTNGIQAVRFRSDRDNTPSRSAACGTSRARTADTSRELGTLAVVAAVLFALGRTRKRG